MNKACFGLFLLIVAAGALPSCGNKKSLSTNVSNDTIDSSKTQMFVWVDNARVRKEADLDADIITQLKAGSIVWVSGEESTKRTKVNLRGVDFNDVWVKVTTESDEEGWIFKPMLTEDQKKAEAMADYVIEPGARVGQVFVDSPRDQVADLFGNEFITEGDIYFPEGMSSPGFYLFRNSPHELQCVVDEYGSIISIYIRQPGAEWETKEGVKMGMTIGDLVELNGEDISFTGFGWDYGGTVMDFNGGKLQKYEGALTIVLSEPEDLADLDNLLGDDTFSTADYDLKDRGVRVAEIGVHTLPTATVE